MPTVGIDGTRFYYEERGKGPALLLVGSTGADTTMLAAAAGLLSTSHRVITYDRRGFGQTAVAALPRSKTWLRRHIDDLALVARELGAVPATIVGWSYGGILALGAAVHHPSIVRDVVLYEPPLHAKKHMSFGMARAIGGAAALGKLRMHERGAERFYRWALGKKTWSQLDAKWRRALLANAKTVVAELDAGTGEELSNELLARVKVPVSIILGGKSNETFAAVADRLVRLYPRARVVRIADGDHVTNVTRPDVFVDAVREAMKRDAAPTVSA